MKAKTILFLALLLNCYVIQAQISKSDAPLNYALWGYVLSEEHDSLSNDFEMTSRLYFCDSLTIDSLVFNLPQNWSIQTPTSFIGNNYGAGDSIDFHISEIHNSIDYASFEQQEKILNISYSDICLSDYGYESEDHDSLFYQNIVNNGTVIITSGGNVRYEDKKEQIFDIPGVIVVGAINRENKILLDNPQYEYACNPYIGICAPGIGITTTHWEGGESSYINGSGTSASAAIVSGVIGLMLSTDNSLTPAEIEYILKTSADSIADYAAANTFVSNYYNNESFVAGSLNAYHAVYKAKHYNDCMPNLIVDSENVSLLIDGFISDTLIVEGTLSVHAPLHMLHNLPHIIVRNGGRLIFEDGGGIFHWEDEIFNGDIIIEAGSTLEFKNGSDIVLAENGEIMVNHDSNNSGELIFNNA
nr:S8/S53 family peptidase [Bacteroidales bacterium]